MTLYNSKKIKIMNFNSSNAPLCVITTTETGSMGRNISPEYKNRKKIMELLGIEKIFYLKQEHTDIVFDSKEIDNNSIVGDGIITSEKKAIAVTVADCLPIFLNDPEKSVYGIVHSGWKGTGIVLNAIKKMAICYGTKPEDVHVIIGPSIGKCCYSVDKERALSFAAKWGEDTVSLREFQSESQSEFQSESRTEPPSFRCKTESIVPQVHLGERREPQYFLDLKKANKLMLERAGVKNIIIDENCTCCNKEFHSYRRDGAEGFGLMLALIGYFG